MAKPAKKRASKSSAGSKRRPSWSLITFAEIEAYRTDRGLPKRRMAELLGVTNSTYHNWARGKAVPTENAQRKLVATLTQPERGGAEAQFDREALQATASIVNTYLETHPGKLSPDQMTRLVREVLSVFA